MNTKEYEKKLKEWEAEGYDVSELREKWFPSRRGRGGSRAGIWMSVVVAVFVVVVGVAIWQVSQPPAPAPAPAPAPVPAPAPSPAPAPTPANKKIVFQSMRDGNWEIYTMNPDGSNQTRLTNNPAEDGYPAWSPDGTKIAFTSNRDGNHEIYIMNADGSNQVRLTNEPGLDADPSWSPDGTKIAFASSRDGNSEVYIMNVDGSNQTRLTNNPATDFSTAWSPDGTKIIFASTRHGGISNYELYVMNADGSNPTRLTNTNKWNLQARFSPDGAKITFTSAATASGPDFKINVMNSDGSNLNPLTTNTEENSSAWSPDGKKIVFGSNRDGNYEIYVMNTDGSNTTRLTNNSAFDWQPDWGSVPAPAPYPTPAPAPAPTVTFALNITTNPSRSGSVSPSSGTYDSGTQITLSAIPVSDYEFNSWAGDASGTSSTITVTMNSNKGIVANFSKIQYSLSASASPPGGGSVSPSSGTYDSGSQVTLTATPSPGWKFDHWGGALDNDVNPTTVPMSGNRKITAYFTAKDTDGDGLTDEEEQQVGTNPGYPDTDHDGLSDYEELKVKNTDPRTPDTDGDGVKDGDDFFPLSDAYVHVVIKYFEDTSAMGEGPDSGGVGDPYFKVWAGSQSDISRKPVDEAVTSINRPFSVAFNVPDNLQYVPISIEVWDSDGGWTGDEQYDAGSIAGDAPSALRYEKLFDILGGTVTETSNGAADGSLQGPQAKIIVEITTKTIPQ